jgi:hypothetical protein
LPPTRTGNLASYLPIYSIDYIGYIGFMTAQTSPMEPSPDPNTPAALPSGLLKELAEALRSIRYGAIELVIHDGRVVQLERREKVRFDTELNPRNR